MRSWSQTFTEAVATGLVAAAVPQDMASMTAYMRHQFPFLGVKAASQRAAIRAALAAAGPAVNEGDVVDAIDAL